MLPPTLPKTVGTEHLPRSGFALEDARVGNSAALLADLIQLSKLPAGQSLVYAPAEVAVETGYSIQVTAGVVISDRCFGLSILFLWVFPSLCSFSV